MAAYTALCAIPKSDKVCVQGVRCCGLRHKGIEYAGKSGTLIGCTQRYGGGLTHKSGERQGAFEEVLKMFESASHSVTVNRCLIL